MAAYVKNANGNWNISTLWTPNGVPGGSDTVTFGDYETIVPEGYTAECGGVDAYEGSSESVRSRLTVNGTLNTYDDVAQGIWTTLRFGPNGKINTNGHDWYTDYPEGNGNRHEIICDGGGWAEFIVGHVGAANGDTYYGKLDLKEIKIEAESFRYGAGWYPGGNHYRLRNVLFYNCGRVDADSFIDDAADWSVENVLFVGSRETVDQQKAWLYCRDKGGTITGVRKFKNVLFDYRGVANAIVRLQYFPDTVWATTTGKPEGLYLAGCYMEALSFNTEIHNVFSTGGVVGEGGMPLVRSYFAPYVNNPHTMQNLTARLTQSIIDSEQPSGSTDAGDHFIVNVDGTNTIDYMVVIDNYGAVMFNALGSPAKTGDYIGNHITYVCDQVDAYYGKAARNENFGTFDPSSNFEFKNSIIHARSNPSGATNGRVFFMETPGDDQIKYVDYNVYNIGSTNPADIYYGVTSATKGPIGSQTGWGANDLIGVDSQFVDQNRGLQSWAGTANREAAVTKLLHGVFGYDATQQKFDNSLVTGDDVGDLIDWVWSGFAPTNPALHNTASDGTDRGAVAFVAPPVSKGNNQLKIGLGISL